MEASKILVVFSHGMQSSPASMKILELTEVAQKYSLRTIAPDYRASVDPLLRTKMLKDELQNVQFEKLILSGSSQGAYVSINYASQLETPVEGLFLLAPAVGIYGFDPKINAKKTLIIHGWNDETVSPDKVFKYAMREKVETIFVDDNHRLVNSHNLICEFFDAFLQKLLAQ